MQVDDRTFINLKNEMRLRDFSDRTVKLYSYYIQRIKTFTGKGLDEINVADIKCFLNFLIDQQKSSATVNLAYSAFKFYFGKVLNRKLFVNLPRYKKDKKLSTQIYTHLTDVGLAGVVSPL